MNNNQYFYNIANAVKLKSKDKSTQIGAVIVGKYNQIISTGYNSFPRGIDDYNDSRQERPEKYFWFEHAERNAIYNAARMGSSTEDSKIYLTCGIPCTDCCRAIIQCGIRHIVCVDSVGNGVKGNQWNENIKRSTIMLKEAGVSVEFYNFEIEE